MEHHSERQRRVFWGSCVTDVTSSASNTLQIKKPSSCLPATDAQCCSSRDERRCSASSSHVWDLPPPCWIPLPPILRQSPGVWAAASAAARVHKHPACRASLGFPFRVLPCSCTLLPLGGSHVDLLFTVCAASGEQRSSFGLRGSD